KEHVIRQILAPERHTHVVLRIEHPEARVIDGIWLCLDRVERVVEEAAVVVGVAAELAFEPHEQRERPVEVRGTGELRRANRRVAAEVHAETAQPKVRRIGIKALTDELIVATSQVDTGNAQRQRLNGEPAELELTAFYGVRRGIEQIDDTTTGQRQR